MVQSGRYVGAIDSLGIAEGKSLGFSVGLRVGGRVGCAVVGLAVVGCEVDLLVNLSIIVQTNMFTRQKYPNEINVPQMSGAL